MKRKKLKAILKEVSEEKRCAGAKRVASGLYLCGLEAYHSGGCSKWEKIG